MEERGMQKDPRHLEILLRSTSGTKRATFSPKQMSQLRFAVLWSTGPSPRPRLLVHRCSMQCKARCMAGPLDIPRHLLLSNRKTSAGPTATVGQSGPMQPNPGHQHMPPQSRPMPPHASQLHPGSHQPPQNHPNAPPPQGHPCPPQTHPNDQRHPPPQGHLMGRLPSQQGHPGGPPMQMQPQGPPPNQAHGGSPPPEEHPGMQPGHNMQQGQPYPMGGHPQQGQNPSSPGPQGPPPGPPGPGQPGQPGRQDQEDLNGLQKAIDLLEETGMQKDPRHPLLRTTSGTKMSQLRFAVLWSTGSSPTTKLLVHRCSMQCKGRCMAGPRNIPRHLLSNRKTSAGPTATGK